MNSECNYRFTPVPLRRTRPFVFKSVSLRDVEELKGVPPENGEAVSRFLAEEVNNAIAAATAAQPPPALGCAPLLPLVRLRVDTTGGFATVALQRFGASFQARVANPWDLLHFHKAAAKRAKRDGAQLGDGDPGVAQKEMEEGASMHRKPDDHRRIGALVNDNLPAQGMSVLQPAAMAAALEDFVQRDEKGSLERCVKNALLSSQRAVAAKGASVGDDANALRAAIDDSLKDDRAARKAVKAAANGEGADEREADLPAQEGPKSAKGRGMSAAAKPPPRESKRKATKHADGVDAEISDSEAAPSAHDVKRRKKSTVDEDAADTDEEMGDDLGAPKVAKKAAPKRKVSAGAKKPAVTPKRKAKEPVVVVVDSGDDEPVAMKPAAKAAAAHGASGWGSVAHPR